MDNVDNRKSLSKDKVIQLKSSQSFNESSLMTLPFVSLKRKKVTKIERKWMRGKEEVGLTVVGTEENGCPTIYELDVLMALFKILAHNMDNKIEINTVVSNEKNNDISLNTTHKIVNMPKVINFTYRGLAKEMGLKGFGKATKSRLEKSIECLTECTIYSSFSIRDAEAGEYVADFKGKKSSRILTNYRSYEINNYRKSGKKLLNPEEILEQQSVEIDDFFFTNMCNNYFKLYDYDKYKKLTKSIAKKLLLILTQWSHGYEKYISFQVLYDYIGIDYKEKDYYKYQVKYAIDELVAIDFIKAYEMRGDGVNFIFNTTAKIKAKNLYKYTTEIEIITRLREIGVSYDDIIKYCCDESMPYISALLRYTDYRLELGNIDDPLKFVSAGLPLNRYNIEDYMTKI